MIRSNHVQLVVIIAIFLFGFSQLLLGGSTLDLWSDEAWSAVVAQQTELATSIDMIGQDFHPPLYFIILNFWDGLAGDEVIVFGGENPIDFLAKKIGTIPYEILTSVSGRVKRVYFNET